MTHWLRSIKAWTMIGVAAGVAIAGVRLSRDDGAGPATLTTAARAAPAPTLPVSADSWRGDIDYAQFDRRAQLVMSDPAMAGMAIAIVENGRLSFVHGYGWADRDAQRPITEHSVFRWASLSKGVAATLSYKLAEQGKLALAEPVADFGTSLRLPKGAENRVTVTDILSHRLGLTKNAFDGRLESGMDAAELRRNLASAPMQCEPGDCHSYQNVAYDTMSEIVAKVSGHSYASEVERQLFEPLGMENASVGMQGLVGAKDWARPYNGKNPIAVNDNYYRVPAAAGVNSTIVDLARWMQAQMGENPDVLAMPLLNEIHRPRVETWRVYGNTAMGHALADPGYGQGWRSFTYAGHWLVGHSGAVNGYRSSMMFDPASRTGIVLLWNSNAGKPFRLQLELFDLFYRRRFFNWAEMEQPKVEDIAAAPAAPVSQGN